MESTELGKTYKKTIAVAGCLLALGTLPALPPAVKADSYTDAFPTVPEAKWVGLRLIILPQSKALQHYGYQELYRDPNGKLAGNNPDTEYPALPYDAFAGKIVRVVGIGQGHGPDGETLDEADLQVEGTQETIHGDIDHGCMTDVAPAADLETAQKLYLGKTLWLASDHLTSYDPQKDTSDAPTSPAWHEAFERVKVKQFSPVKVLDIVPGWYASSPIRFVVQAASGEQGYVDVHMSSTNVPANLQAVDRFQDKFLETDPRTQYAWPPKVWAALENKEIFPEMTAQQVRMSWGAPKGTQTISGQDHTEQWTYDPGYVLTLKDGVLQTITSQPAPSK